MLTPLYLTSTITSAAAPFTVGHPFKKGDVPAGSSVISDIADFQCAPKAYWEDGTLKFAILSGKASLTANVEKTVTLSVGAAPGGTALTITDLKAAAPVVTVALANAKDWTFGTASHTVGARLAMSNALDVFVGASSTITVDNGATIGALTATQDIGTANVVLTAPLSGGAVNGYQTVKYRAKYKVKRNISAILPGTVTRVSVTGGWKTSGGATTDGLGAKIAAVGNTLTFAGVGGMTQLNGLTGTITAVGPDPYAWVEVNIDSTGFSAFTSGGTATKNELNTSDFDDVAYVRTGGGLEWNGTATTYSAANATGQTSVSWATTDWDAPFESLESGPKMSSWKYRKAITPDPHMVAWLEVRLYAGGAVQILPYVENGMLMVDRPTAKQATFALTINGVEKFNRLVELKSHTRTVLIYGTHLCYWTATDPNVVPRHNREYIYSTRLIPTYIHVTPDSAPTLSGQAYTSFEPFQRGNHQVGMGSAGFQADIGIIPNHDALYFTNGSRKSYEGMVRNGFSTGRYRIHYRDEANGWHRPLRFSQHPNLVMNSKDAGMSSIGISTTLEYTPTSTGGTASGRTFSSSHTPSMGYGPHMVTGWDYFREEMEFLATLVYLKQVNTERGLSNGILKTNVGANQTRGAAWALIHLGQAAALGKDGDALTTEMRTSLIENIKYYYNKYLAQGEVCPFGLTELYTDYGSKASVGMEASAFQSDFFTQAIGFIRNLDPLLPADVREQLRLVSLYKYKSVIGRLGEVGATEFPYQYLGNGYDIPVSPNQLKATADRVAVNWDPSKGPTGPWFSSWREVFDRRFPGVVPVANGPLLGDFTGPGSYFSNALPAISLAVEHGAPGALVAYNRLVGASNWNIQNAAYVNTPVYGIKPYTMDAEAGATAPRGRKVRVSKTPLIPGKCIVGFRGFGVLAEDIPEIGTSGPGLNYSGLSFPRDTGKEVLLEITPPTNGILTVDPNYGAVYDGGSDTISMKVSEDGALKGTSTTLFNMGDIGTPSAPIIGFAGAGDGMASVSFTAPVSDGGSAISFYTVTSSNGESTSGTSSPILIAVPNDIPVSFTVTATNAIGVSPPSQPTQIITPVAAPVITAPGAPADVVATAGNAFVTVTFTAPNDGGSAITQFTVAASTGQSANGASSPINVSVPNGVAVSFTVTATNMAGTSPASAASSIVTPSAPAQGAPVIINAAWTEAPETFLMTGTVQDATAMAFTPSAARMIQVLPNGKAFQATGDFWTMTDAKKPRGLKDPDATIDIPFDWAPWLADINDTILSVEFLVDGGLVKEAQGVVGSVAAVFVSAGTASGNVRASITCRITTASNPSRIEDRTVYLDIEAR